MEAHVRPYTFVEEVMDTINLLKEEGTEGNDIRQIILKTYGDDPTIKELLDEELLEYKAAAQSEEEKPPDEEEEKPKEDEEPELDPEVQKLIKYYLRQVKKMDRADIMKLFGMVMTYFLSRKPKLLPGLVKKFKRQGVE